ncbi:MULTISPECIES: MATE family efflux transporter [Sutcliffiella]|uniref:Probable multidrug resistance protein NorM n=1 Tax=Sutcliffiella cohnii TaxID=33932 RepID=A0A223KQZ3_9BACI|nr:MULTISPECIES: MATE family efflux transporter [Sutcliffiella]AST91807.1 MATE family efflux transporter [Sutcliffiella cohnii]MED4018611.1 MATE family efflux transporter [Sutcliffiella cohnii]WBL13025.1 MATE family efflux transporter [Sutcliffiella sp. NC1]
MKQAHTYRDKLKIFIQIVIPIVITQVSLSSMNLFDIMMTGNVSATDLAGVAVGSGLWIPVYTGLSGILLSITPIVAQLVGGKKGGEVSNSVTQGLYVSIVMSLIVICLGAIVLNPILNGMTLENEVRYVAKYYLIALSFGIFPLFAYSVVRSFIDALGHTRISMIITLLSLPINVLLNYVLIFGKLGLPSLGGIGAGIASALTYWLILIISLFIVLKYQPFAVYGILKSWVPIQFNKWKEILLIGVPIGLSIFFETSIFSAVTLLMSAFDTITIAAHQVALNFASFLYMIPLSISMALTILVGFEVGAKRWKDARQYTFLGISIAVIFSSILAIFLFFLREEIASLYTKDTDVLLLTTVFLIYALFFQLSDAIAAPIQGALRGYKDVNAAFYLALISYWVIGLPIGFILANFTELGAFGYWVGLIVGLAAGAIGLSFRLIHLQKKVVKMESE